MTKFPIPDAALARHIACVGETGSGKTHNTKTIVEHVVAEGYRVCVLDTIKSDWWGVTSSASGKKAGLPFTILGGPRGHVPLHSSAGKAIGQLVGEGKLPHSIIDMADFEPGGPQKFFEHFAQALWRHTKGVVYLVIEEAHELAPKERAGFHAENMALHWAKKLATGSRTKGIRLIIASQRTQAVHNALLGSCGTLMAHSLSLPADQKPVVDWLKANLRDQDLLKTITNDLAFLPQGTAWVCCAKDDFFKKIHFPAIATFDNTATPDKDADEFDVATAAVDADALRLIIGDAVKEAEANDPKALKAEIAKLRQQVGGKAVAAPSAGEITAAEQRGYERGFKAGEVSGRHHAIRIVRDRVDALEAEVAPYHETISAPARPQPKLYLETQPPLILTKPARRERTPRAPADPNAPLDSAATKLFDAIRAHSRIPLTWDEVCVLAGMVPGNGYFYGGKKRLIDGHHVIENGDGRPKLNDPDDALPELALTAADVVRMWQGKVGAPGSEMLRVIAAHAGEPVAVDILAREINHKPGNGYWYGGVKRLKAARLVEQGGSRDGLRAAAILHDGRLS